MGKSNDDIWTLVAKQITGELTEEEAKQLTDWQQERPENQTTVEQTKELWQASKRSEPFYEPNVEEGWQRFVFRRDQQSMNRLVGTNTSTNGADHTKSRSLFWWGGIAASLALLLIFGWFWQSETSETDWQEFATAEEETLQLTLPDSSQVWLNSNSTTRYADNFNVESRTVFWKEKLSLK